MSDSGVSAGVLTSIADDIEAMLSYYDSMPLRLALANQKISEDGKTFTIQRPQRFLLRSAVANSREKLEPGPLVYDDCLPILHHE